MRSTYLKINGLKHHLCTWGKSSLPKLFFFHGWLDMGASFEFVARKLQNNYHCIALDWRGMGYSQHSKNALGYFFVEYLSDVHALLNEFSPNEPARVVAHSLGGNVLALYAGTCPERISHLINIEGFGIRDCDVSEGPKQARNWLEKNKKHRFKFYPSIKPIAEKLCANNPRLPKQRALFLAQNLCRKTPRGFQIACDPRHKWLQPQIFQLKMTYPYWKNIQAKVINVIAAETEMAKWLKTPGNVQTEIDQRLAHFPPSSKRIKIENCGHMVHHEKPDELAQIIQNFLNG